MVSAVKQTSDVVCTSATTWWFQSWLLACSCRAHLYFGSLTQATSWPFTCTSVRLLIVQSAVLLLTYCCQLVTKWQTMINVEEWDLCFGACAPYTVIHQYVRWSATTSSWSAAIYSLTKCVLCPCSFTPCIQNSYMMATITMNMYPCSCLPLTFSSKYENSWVDVDTRVRASNKRHHAEINVFRRFLNLPQVSVKIQREQIGLARQPALGSFTNKACTTMNIHDWSIECAYMATTSKWYLQSVYIGCQLQPNSLSYLER